MSKLIIWIWARGYRECVAINEEGNCVYGIPMVDEEQYRHIKYLFNLYIANQLNMPVSVEAITYDDVGIYKMSFSVKHSPPVFNLSESVHCDASHDGNGFIQMGHASTGFTKRGYEVQIIDTSREKEIRLSVKKFNRHTEDIKVHYQLNPHNIDHPLLKVYASGYKHYTMVFLDRECVLLTNPSPHFKIYQKPPPLERVKRDIKSYWREKNKNERAGIAYARHRIKSNKSRIDSVDNMPEIILGD